MILYKINNSKGYSRENFITIAIVAPYSVIYFLVFFVPIPKGQVKYILLNFLIAQSSVDSVYDAILQDLWFAKDNVQDDNVPSNKMVVTKGAVNSILAKVYATMPTPKWDSVAYYFIVTK